MTSPTFETSRTCLFFSWDNPISIYKDTNFESL